MKELAILVLRNEGKTLTLEKERYQSITEPLMFSMIKTRLDIACSISTISRFIKNIFHQHTEVVKTIFYYLNRI